MYLNSFGSNANYIYVQCNTEKKKHSLFNLDLNQYEIYKGDKLNL